MGTMPVFSVHEFHKHGKTDDCMRSYLSDSRLPVFYMGDYSILGLLVDDLPKALKILLEKDFLVSEGARTRVSQVESGNLQEIIHVLHRENIECEIADIIKEVYQG